MGIREDVLALANDVESTIGGCYGCLLDKRGLCKADSDFDCNDEVCKFVAHRLRAIVVRDAKDDTTVSAYDLLPDEDREAIAWVREQGGLEAVKDSVKTNEWALSLAIIAHDALFGEDSERDTTPTEFKRELDKRMVPPGMEWPRFEDGAPMRIGDEVHGDYGLFANTVEAVEFISTYYGVRTVLVGDCLTRHTLDDTHVKRPAPKVLDADGVEIRVGDTVWHVETGEQCKVVEVDSRSVSVDFRVDGDGTKHTGSILPANLTHRAPVIASDGKPLEVGQTVYSDSLGEGPFTVREIKPDDDPDEPEHLVWCGETWGESLNYAKKWRIPDQLTHEQPDTWERLEHDAKKTVCEYFGANYDCANCPPESARCAEEVKKDIIRRAKKLAERGA